MITATPGLAYGGMIVIPAETLLHMRLFLVGWHSREKD